MDTYDFFLFSKLFDIIIKTKMPYDDLYPITCYYYEQFTNQDNDESIGLYNPNPEDLEMLHAIAKAVKDNNADIGFGFDGDGDRVGVIDNTGMKSFQIKLDY